MLVLWKCVARNDVTSALIFTISVSLSESQIMIHFSLLVSESDIRTVTFCVFDFMLGSTGTTKKRYEKTSIQLNVILFLN